MPYDQQKVSRDAIEACARMDWHHLLIFQQQLAEHILHCYEYKLAEKLEDRDKPEKAPSTC
jgi:hypothetical protein